jgi:hypothetical protein
MKKILIILSLALIAVSCGNRQPKNAVETEQDTLLQNSQENSTKQETLDGIADIDTFSDFPPEISGCACYFSNDKTEFENKQYIFMYDFEEISFIKINGILTKLIRVREDDEININFGNLKFENDNYEMEIEFIDIEDDINMEGKIKLKDENGKTISKTMYGFCGC